MDCEKTKYSWLLEDCSGECKERNDSMAGLLEVPFCDKHLAQFLEYHKMSELGYSPEQVRDISLVDRQTIVSRRRKPQSEIEILKEEVANLKNLVKSLQR